MSEIDFLFIPVGGGGLSAGAGSYFKTYSPRTKIIGLEPEGAPSMHASLQAGYPVTLDQIDRFVDGAAVKKVGDLTFSICREVLDDMHLVPEGKVCSTILKLYNEDAIVEETAGARTIAAVDIYAKSITEKKGVGGVIRSILSMVLAEVSSGSPIPMYTTLVSGRPKLSRLWRFTPTT